MFSKVKNCVNNKILKNNVVFALIYFVVFNAATIYHIFQNNKVSHYNIIVFLLKRSFLHYVLILIFFIGISINRLVFVVLSSLLFVFSAIYIYSYYILFQANATQFDVVMFIYKKICGLQIDFMLNIRFISWICFSLSMLFYSIKYKGIEVANSLGQKILATAALFICINMVLIPCCKDSYMPFNQLHNLYKVMVK